ANVLTPYKYPALATDADGDFVTYTLTQAPCYTTPASKINIDANTGLITWTPAANQLGLHTVTIKASDGKEGFAYQSFQIQVEQKKGNSPPVIVSDPRRNFMIPAEIGTGPNHLSSKGLVNPTVLQVPISPGKQQPFNVSFTLDPAVNPVVQKNGI